MHRITMAVTATLISGQPLAAFAQSSGGRAPAPATAKARSTNPDTSKAAVTVRSGAVPDQRKRENAWSPLAVTTFARSVYDSNIGHDQKYLDSYGLIAGASARYQSRQVRAPLTATYALARHAYTQGSEWNRFSQDLNVVASGRFSRRMTFETIGEITLKGSSEDRDIGDNYIFLPRLSYRLSPSQRFRGYGAYRIKRYDTASDRNAVNRYAGLEFRQSVGKGGQWEASYRYETNSAQAARQSYTRRTYDSQYTAALFGHNQIVGELKYRAQRYDKRLIVVDSVTRPRMDHRFQPSIGLTHLLNQRVVLGASYEFEHRTSNDPRRGYRDHLVSLSTEYRW